MKKTIISISLLLFIYQVAWSQSNRPNILLILSDDHGYQAISAYGNRLVQTPSIDRIAKEGALFRNAVVANSICGPSRATLLTGTFSHKNGYKLNDGVLDTTQHFLPELLNKQGYQTAWIGKWHLGSLPRGFGHWQVMPVQGHYFNPDFIRQERDTVLYNGYVSDIITNLTLDYLSNRNKDKPFFLVVGEKATHREWLPDIQDLGAYDSIQFPLPKTFYDDYEGRVPALQQHMEVGKILSLDDDLKIYQSFGQKKKMSKVNNLSQREGKKIDNATMRYYQEGEYSRMDSTQSAAYSKYYGKLRKDFDSMHLSGKQLTEWKYQRFLKDYYATAKSMDRNIGKILHYLDSTRLSKNTIIIYASDQGFYLGEHGWFDKRFIYDPSLKTPLVLYNPLLPQLKGKELTQIVSNVDWAPTILDMAGLQTPAYMQGRSFLPLLKKPSTKNWSNGAYYHYYETPGPHNIPAHFGIRTDHYMLACFYGQHIYWELYDIDKDPDETHNLYPDSKYKERFHEMKDRLRKLTIQYDDKEALELLDHTQSE